ncbi:hypothetical protein KR038_005891 [Drosophila bunnanda]|nr:hypothetical protein KR038_005891 [Drosophila bunnanda]
MVVGAFPLAKLGLLGIKHIAKPITTLIKRTAVRNPAFKTLVVSPSATVYHNVSVRTKLWMMGMRQPRFVPPLNKAMSVEMGSDLLGEMSIFLIGAFLLTAEFFRKSRSDKFKKEERKIVQQQLETKITELTEKVAFQTMEIRQLRMMVGSMDRSYDCCCS